MKGTDDGSRCGSGGTARTGSVSVRSAPSRRPRRTWRVARSVRPRRAARACDGDRRRKSPRPAHRTRYRGQPLHDPRRPRSAGEARHRRLASRLRPAWRQLRRRRGRGSRAGRRRRTPARRHRAGSRPHRDGHPRRGEHLVPGLLYRQPRRARHAAGWRARRAPHRHRPHAGRTHRRLWRRSGSAARRCTRPRSAAHRAPISNCTSSRRPSLVEAGRPVAICTGIPGNFRYPDARIEGSHDHVGLPRRFRRDAAMAGAEFAMALDQSVGGIRGEAACRWPARWAASIPIPPRTA